MFRKHLWFIHTKPKYRKPYKNCIIPIKYSCMCWSLSRVRLFATPQTVAHQASPSMEFSRQEHWSGLPFPSLRAMVREKFIALNSYFRNGERFKDNRLSLQFRTEKEK